MYVVRVCRLVGQVSQSTYRGTHRVRRISLTSLHEVLCCCGRGRVLQCHVVYVCVCRLAGWVSQSTYTNTLLCGPWVASSPRAPIVLPNFRPGSAREEELKERVSLSYPYSHYQGPYLQAYATAELRQPMKNRWRSIETVGCWWAAVSVAPSLLQAASSRCVCMCM